MKKALIFAVLVLWLGAFYAQRQLQYYHGRQHFEQGLHYLPSGEALKILSLGYREVTADFLWFSAIQYLGGRNNWPPEDRTFYDLLDRATTLDPLYEFIYHAAGVCLTKYGQQYELSIKILQKGMNALGENLNKNKFGWWLPFLIGYDYFFYLGDDKNGARYMMIAAQLPGSPRYLPGLTATLLKDTGDLQAGIAFLEKLRGEARDDMTRLYFDDAIQRKKNELLGKGTPDAGGHKN